MQGPICRGGLRAIMAVPGQTDWQWTALLQRALRSTRPIILHPKTLSGARTHDSSAYSSKNLRLHTNNLRSQSLEGGTPDLKRRHAQASPVLGLLQLDWRDFIACLSAPVRPVRSARWSNMPSGVLAGRAVSQVHQSRCCEGRAPAASPPPSSTSCDDGDTHPNVLGVLIIFDLSLFSLFVLPIQVIVRCSRVMVFSLF